MFDRTALAAALAERPDEARVVARVVVAAVKGSSPREVGAAMLVWADGQSGTIGGGALEWQATKRARTLLATGGTSFDTQALGPALNQCCGGAVTLVTEVFTPATLPPETPVFARSLDGSPMPLAVRRLIDMARAQGRATQAQFLQGWMVEPMARPRRALWVWGAGHVGRALIGVLAPLPDLALTWVDTDASRFPDTAPEGVGILPVAQPETAIRLAPPGAEHLILTYSHALDLALCHGLLTHGFGSCGLIGSATKWARFRARLGALGHGAAAIDRITCPIGDPALGKHPQAIAISVAHALMSRPTAARQSLPRLSETTSL
jgi:xanthine dehydrogenase accessory factor